MKINYREISCSFLFSLITHFNINSFRFFARYSIVTSFSAQSLRWVPVFVSTNFSLPLTVSAFLFRFFRLPASVSRWTCQFSLPERVKRSAGPILRDCIGLHFHDAISFTGNIDGRQAYTCLPVSKTLKFGVNSAYYVTMKIYIESPVNLIWNNDHYL